LELMTRGLVDEELQTEIDKALANAQYCLLKEASRRVKRSPAYFQQLKLYYEDHPVFVCRVTCLGYHAEESVKVFSDR
jgi:hypothetical protein